MENRKCPKCRSQNSAEATFCRYCHERFNQAKTFVDQKKKKWINGKLVLAGGILAIAAGYFWKKKSSKTEKPASEETEIISE